MKTFRLWSKVCICCMLMGNCWHSAKSFFYFHPVDKWVDNTILYWCTLYGFMKIHLGRSLCKDLNENTHKRFLKEFLKTEAHVWLKQTVDLKQASTLPPEQKIQELQMFLFCLLCISAGFPWTSPCGRFTSADTVRGVSHSAKVTEGSALMRGTQKDQQTMNCQFCFYFASLFGLELAFVLSTPLACSVLDSFVMRFFDKP